MPEHPLRCPKHRRSVRRRPPKRRRDRPEPTRWRTAARAQQPPSRSGRQRRRRFHQAPMPPPPPRVTGPNDAVHPAALHVVRARGGSRDPAHRAALPPQDGDGAPRPSQLTRSIPSERRTHGAPRSACGLRAYPPRSRGARGRWRTLRRSRRSSTPRSASTTPSPSPRRAWARRARSRARRPSSASSARRRSRYPT